MRGLVALTAAVLAAVVLTACGSSRPASLPVGPHSHVQGPGSIVFVSGGRSTALGVDNTDLVAASSTGRVSDLTSTPAAENTAAWSADGSHVVYVRQSSSGMANGAIAFRAGVYVWSPGHGAPHRIDSCSDPCTQTNFAWSPDNRKIAFIAGGIYSEPDDLEVMNADGSGVQVICDPKRCGYGLAKPVWSPDGRKLVFSNVGALDTEEFGGSPPSPIWVANADGTGLTKLTQPNCVPGDPQRQDCSFDTSPVWSPNGRLIAYSSNRRGPARPKPFGPTGARRYLPPIVTTSIVVMHADGSHPHTIYRCASEKCSETVPLAWSPDGRSVAVGPITAANSSIRIATLTGETTTLSTCSGSKCLHADELAWSPDGKQLAFLADNSVWTIDRNGSSLHQTAGGTCCLAWVGTVSLSGARTVPPPTDRQLHLSGSIAYGPVANDLRPINVLFFGPAGTQLAHLTSARGKEPVFSPDGSEIAFTGTIPKDYQWHILVADRDGKHVRALTDLPGEAPAWSPDGRTIAFTRETGGEKRWIALVSATGGDYRNLTSAGWGPSWSPDGRQLVFQRRFGGVEDTLFTVGANGRGLKRLTNLPGSQGSPAWSPDGTEIAFDWYTPAGVSLYLIHPDGTHLRRVTTAAAPTGKPAWSPDGRYLLVMSSDYQARTSTPIVAIDVRTGRVSTVATVPGAVTGPSWSSR